MLRGRLGGSPFAGGVSSFVAAGDSITDRMSNFDSSYGFVSCDASGWGTALECLSNQRIKSVARGATGISGSPPPANDRDFGYSGINALQYRLGSGAGPGSEWLGAHVPITAALAAAENADCIICHIGTNDLPSLTAQQTADRVIALWGDLVGSGKPVVGTDILQRTATYSGWNSTLRDKVDATNAILRGAWRAAGLAAYRQWNDLIEKDGSGYAAAREFPNDGIHPTQRVGWKLGRDLMELLGDYIDGTAYPIPVSGSGLWVTPNPYVTGGATIATGWAGIGVTVGTNLVASKVTDGDGTVWQRCAVNAAIGFSQAGLYDRITSGIPASGTRVRACARVRIPSAGALTSISLQVQQLNAPQASDWMELFARAGGTTTASPLVEGDDFLMISDPFTVQASVTQLWCAVCFTSATGGGTYDFTQAGVFLDP